MFDNLEKKVQSLEIQILKDKQYNRRNCIEFSGIPDTINDDKLEERIIVACKDVKGTVMQIGNTLLNDHLSVSKLF